MSGAWTGWIPVAVVIIALAALYLPMGKYMAWALNNPKDTRIESGFYRLIGVKADGKQHWVKYSASVMAFSAVSVVFLYLLQRT